MPFARKPLLIAIFVLANCALPTSCLTAQQIDAQFDDYWSTYKATYNKTYAEKEEPTKRLAWEANLRKIYEHNLLAAAGHHNYTLRDNEMADLGRRHYVREMLKLVPSHKRRMSGRAGPSGEGLLASTGVAPPPPGNVPSRLDWREMGFRTEPENQRGCGSCYAYSIAAAIEGQIFRRTGRLVPLSVQQLVDCSTLTGNLGCQGGSLKNTLRYLERSMGLMARAAYPYSGEKGRCGFARDMIVVNLTSWAILPARDEKALEAALATVGPIAASINASPKTFQLYQGIYHDAACTSNIVNHAVLIVGYTPTEWIIKNWWGESWGEEGYMRLARHGNLCGIANYAAYVRV